jgi:DNA-binding IclR family transcriptional regulator
VSRVLKTLALAGYVRKPGYHSFAADYGVLTLGGNALQQFAYSSKPGKAMAALAARAPGMQVALAILWRGQLLYFHRMQHGNESVPISVGFPLHLSSVGLRMLIDLPKQEALAALKESRQRYGWERPTPQVPRRADETLELARGLVRHDTLVLEDYYQPGHLGCAIPITAKNEPQASLALSGPKELYPIDTVLLLLQEGRRAIEAAMDAGR